MTTIVISVIYGLGFLWSWKPFVLGILTSLESDCPDVGLDTADRIGAIFFGTLLAVVWPAFLICRSIFRLAMAKDVFQTPKELQKAERAELEAYRKQAKEFKLPAPEIPREER